MFKSKLKYIISSSLQVVGFIWGYICQQFSQTMYILLAGFALSCIVSKTPICSSQRELTIVFSLNYLFYVYVQNIRMFLCLVDSTSLANVQTKTPPVAERKARTIIRSKGGQYSIPDFSEVKEKEVNLDQNQ